MVKLANMMDLASLDDCSISTSDFDSLDNFSINAMTPAPEATGFLVPAFLLARLALRTPMAVDAFRVIALGLVEARRHSCHLLKHFLFIFAQVVFMVMPALRSIAGYVTLQEVHVA